MADLRPSRGQALSFSRYLQLYKENDVKNYVGILPFHTDEERFVSGSIKPSPNVGLPEYQKEIVNWTLSGSVVQLNTLAGAGGSYNTPFWDIRGDDVDFELDSIEVYVGPKGVQGVNFDAQDQGFNREFFYMGVQHFSGSLSIPTGSVLRVNQIAFDFNAQGKRGSEFTP